MITYPQRHCAMVHFQMARNLSKIHSINIHLGRVFAQALRIALLFGFRCVLPSTVHTAIALRPGFCFACFVLASCLLARWAAFHVPILAHPFSHSHILLSEHKRKIVVRETSVCISCIPCEETD